MDHALLQERYQTVSVVFSIFFVSCKQILSHTLFLVVSRLEKKKKKHTWVCWLHTLGDVSFSSTTSTSPTDVQLFRGLQTDQLNLINIQVKITFSACVTTFTIDTDSQNIFSTPTKNPQSSGALLENFQPDLFHLHTDPLYWLYENVLLLSSENWHWIKQYSLSKEHFFYRPFLLITFQF